MTTAKADDQLPRVSVIISAFNEEKHIGERIRNILNQDYPAEKLELLIGSDGSSDGTEKILRQFEAEARCHCFIFEQNRGKASVLNDLVSQAKGELLVFSDANTAFSTDNVSRLVRRFSDDATGGVCGELRIYDPGEGPGENQDNAYWRYERFLKEKASALRCLPGANGANYAIRRELYEPIPTETIVDDFVIGCRVVLKGYDLIYAPEAIAWEEQAPSTENEFKRRIRIGNGNYQALGWLLGGVLRSRPAFIFVFFSHKLLRWLVPHCLVLILITNLLLAPGSLFYGALLLLQSIGYLLAFLVHRSSRRERWPTPVLLLYFLLAMNLGLGRGFLRFLGGGGRSAWERTAR